MSPRLSQTIALSVWWAEDTRDFHRQEIQSLPQEAGATKKLAGNKSQHL